ncbi:cobalamin B12-binding domain-containing protein [Candidatus Woesearchaeota archaeon]|nr:cobalamin B12-binding domain-containing protein [Candidatus Woesearchaeota archaeon]
MTLLKNEIKSVVFPLGLGYIAAALEKNGFEVQVLDAIILDQNKNIVRNDMIHLGLDWPELYREIERIAPDVVGISCLFSSQSGNAYKVAELVKQFNPNLPIIMGGAHPSSVPEEVLANPNVDFVVLGEGEATMVKLLNHMTDITGLKQIKGIGFKHNKKIIINSEREFIENIDDISLPARHLFPMELYLNSEMGHGADLMRKPIVSMITSRGCPYNCVYCSVHTVWGRKFRARSPKNVVDEIELLVKQYGVREIHFEDDNLTLKRERMIDICKEIVARNLDIKWTTPNGVAIWTLDKEVLTWMKKAGCYKLCFGIESGDPETQKFIRKSIPLDKCKEIVREANKLGIWTHGFFIIGFPFEDQTSINNTLNYAIDSDLDFASFFLATPYPKTDLYAIMNENGMIGHLTWETLRVSAASINTKYFTREELTKIQKDMFKKFVLHRVLSMFNPVKLSYRLKRLRNKEDRQLLMRFGKRFLQVVS